MICTAQTYYLQLITNYFSCSLVGYYFYIPLNDVIKCMGYRYDFIIYHFSIIYNIFL